MRELEKLSKNKFLLWVWTPIIWILSDRQKKKNTEEVFEETNTENFKKTGKNKIKQYIPDVLWTASSQKIKINKSKSRFFIEELLKTERKTKY